LIIILHTLYTL